jgi:hypothetical protein
MDNNVKRRLFFLAANVVGTLSNAVTNTNRKLFGVADEAAPEINSPGRIRKQLLPI